MRPATEYNKRVVGMEEDYYRRKRKTAEENVAKAWEKTFDDTGMKEYYQENKAHILWQKTMWADLMKDGVIIQDDD